MLKIKSISIKEPYATWIMQGLKDIETRTWKTKYRGKLLIVASKHPKTDNSGLALCVVDLVHIRKMKPEDMAGALCSYFPNRYSWVLKNPRRIKKFNVIGRQGIYNVPNKKIKYIRK